MNEVKVSSSIDEVLKQRLLPEYAQSEAIAALFHHPLKDTSEIRKATRIAVFSPLGGFNHSLSSIHLINRLFAFWAILAGLKSKEEPWRELTEFALKGAEHLMFDYPDYGALVREVSL